jgi:hypothetical protein
MGQASLATHRPSRSLRSGMLHNGTAHLPDLPGKSPAVPREFSDPAPAFGAGGKRPTVLTVGVRKISLVSVA